MSTCRKCGQEIVFRTNNYGQRIPIHFDGTCDGYGNNSSIEQYNIRFKKLSSYVNPNAKCPECDEQVFFYQSEYGGKVYFDELGPPWPKHACTDSRKKTIVTPSWLKAGWKPCILISYSSDEYLLKISVINKDGKTSRCFGIDMITQNPNSWASDWNGEPMFYKNVKGSGPTIKTFIIKNGNIIECSIMGTVISERKSKK